MTDLRLLNAWQTCVVLICISVLLVGLICADAVYRGIDRNFPGLYRNTASLGIAVSELCHSTRGFIGLEDVSKELEKGGFIFLPTGDQKPFEALAAHPDQAHRVLESACRLPHIDRSRTFALKNNETGTIDYDILALALFGYHIQAFFWLFIMLVGLVAVCYFVSFSDEPVFILPSVFWLLMLLTAVHHIDPANLQIGTPANARWLPIFSFYPMTLALALSASGRPTTLASGIAAAVCGGVFALCANARSLVLWQSGTIMLMCALVAAAPYVSHRFMPMQKLFARCKIWPLVVFGIAAGGVIALHHARKDEHAYATSTFTGHEYWDAFLDDTYDDAIRAGQIPELEKRSGLKIDNSTDAYIGALLRIKIKQLGDDLNNYIVDGFWKADKKEEIAREVVFDFWRHHPLEMLKVQWRATKVVFDNIWSLLPKLVIVSAILAVAARLNRLSVWTLCIGVIALTADPLMIVSTFALLLGAVFPISSRARLTGLLAAGTLAMCTELAATVVLPTVIPEGSGYFHVAWFFGLLLFMLMPLSLGAAWDHDAAQLRGYAVESRGKIKRTVAAELTRAQESISPN